jgi:DNA invertase Pin-like site-specific DNA recombinase
MVVGVAFVSLGEGYRLHDAGRALQLHIPALTQFQRARIVERVRAGMARAKRIGKRLGRRPLRILDDDLARVAHLSQH